MYSRLWPRVALLSAVAAAILVLSLIPDPPIELGWLANADKVQHWVAYLVLGFLVYLTIQHGEKRRLAIVGLSVALCTIYGGLIEVLQTFTGRSADAIDFFVNMFGASAGAVASLGSVEISIDSKRRRTGRATGL